MRYGTIIRPLPTDPREAWGVLNPGGARGPDGQLYLFPRIVAEGNVSRVAIGRVRFGRDGEPIDVDRLGVVLEPETPYEMAPGGLGGCEDPRITYIAALDRYVMAYAALDYMHPRVALAISHDLLTWQRLGLVELAPELGIEWNALTDKDASFFPEPINDPEGRPSLALVHRPTYMMSHPDATITVELPHGVEDPRDSIWISYADLAAAQGDVRSLTHLRHHRLLATPRADWEQLKIGGGTAPVLTHLGWLMLYHGVTVEPQVVPSAHPLQKRVRYTARAMVLVPDDPTRVL